MSWVDGTSRWWGRSWWAAKSSPPYGWLATTERYTHVAITKLQEVHAKTHPAAKLPPAPPKEGGG